MKDITLNKATPRRPIIPKFCLVSALILSAANFVHSDSILNLAGVTIDGVSASTSGYINTAYFARADVMTSGTGYENPFLIIQQHL